VSAQHRHSPLCILLAFREGKEDEAGEPGLEPDAALTAALAAPALTRACLCPATVASSASEGAPGWSVLGGEGGESP